MPGDLETIRMFLEVAEQESFAAAARRLNVSPPAVTRAVGALEAKLGVQLLLRTTRQVSLTAAGAAYAARVRPLVEGIEAAAQDLRAEAGALSGRLRINAPLSLGRLLLPQAIAAFREEHPGVAFAVTLTDRLIDVMSEPADLAIRISGPPSDKLTIWRRICPVRRCLVASPGLLAREGRPRDPGDLAGRALLGYGAEAGPEVWELTHGPRRMRATAGTPVAANNGELIAELAARGEGVALLPRFIVEDQLRDGTLEEILPEWSAPQLWLTLHYPPYERLPRRVAAFSDFFETYATRTKPV
ncbi:LysR substrate-binding domain-containing protein [Albimonas sp. CAU 1670]|uniref:LysR family transcriptional regulator n=1 Tax=Albimonas sp. CAU 1670 TaxID=3032599 RepID=UPI0023DC9162|nr:LysR family transcriptional regulator [Albimonas sp. CAU 1670]MDF2235287.1 LysR substrate-binding domain-containing protein [Albimonas sp. CAU 1670]